MTAFAIALLGAVGGGAIGSGVIGAGSVGGMSSSVSSSTPLPAGDAVEVGHTLYGTDWADISSAPSGGTIVSMWTRIPETTPSGYPWARGNLEVFMIGDAEWYLRCIVGNIGITDANTATYNANVMLFAELDGDHVGDWVADYAYYNGGHTEAEVRGWVWVAWQVVVEASQFRFRQWLKMGVSDDAFLAAESTVTFADVRTILAGLGWSAGDRTAWTPGQPNYIRVGTDQNNSHIWHVRVDEGTSAPSLATLDAIAEATAYDAGAWADWAFSWHGGAADLDDGSGHSRDLAIEAGGTLYDGLAAPY